MANATLPQTVIRDDEDRKIIFHGDIPKDRVKIKGGLKLLIASGATEKFQDWDRAAKGNIVDMALATHLIALEDSEEVEENAVEIALGKVDITLIDGLKELSQPELDNILEKMGVSDVSQLMGMSEDRSLNIDPRYKDYHEFQQYKDEHLLAEIFEEGADFPGHRIKELTTAMGGPLEFLRTIKRAKEALPKMDPVKYADLSEYHESCIAVAFKPLAENNPYLPQEGIVIEVIGKKHTLDLATFKRLRELHRDGKDADLDLGYFEYAPDEEACTSEMRVDFDNSYFDEGSIIADAWNTFSSFYAVPKRAAPRSCSPIIIRDPAILTDRPFGKFKKKLSGVFGKAVQAQVQGNEIASLADLEEPGITTHAVVLQGAKKAYKNDALLKNIRKVESLLRFSAFATLKTVYDPFHHGEPMLLHQRLKESVMPILDMANKRKTSPLKPSMICDFYDSASDMRNKLVWDPRYKAPEYLPQPAAYDLCTQSDFFGAMGIEKPDLLVGTVASASLNAPAALCDAHHIGYELSAHGVSMINGGSSRHLMAKPTYAAIDAYKDGYRDFVVIGSRETAISAREGGIKRLQAETGLEISKGNLNADYFKIDQFLHFKVFDNLAERQHSILGSADVVFMLPGGLGTIYETLGVALNNLYIRLDERENRPAEKQRNFFPGFERKIRPIFAVNSQVNGDPNIRYLDFMKEIFTDQELDMAGISFHKNGEEAMQALTEYRAAQGKPLKRQQPAFRAA